MITRLKPVETKLEEIFVKSAPPLPKDAIRVLVQYLPWINLVIGVLTVFATYALYRAAHAVNGLVDYANQLSKTYGGDTISTSGLTFMVWVCIAVLLVEAALFIMAFPATRDRKKSGWDLMFYAALVNVVYGVFSLFIDQGGIGSLIGTLIGSAIGFYFLFQIRASYLGKPATMAAHKAAAKPVKK